MSRYRPKDNIFKTLCSYAKNYVHEVKNSIKSSKIVKNGPQIVKNENFQKQAQRRAAEDRSGRKSRESKGSNYIFAKIEISPPLDSTRLTL